MKTWLLSLLALLLCSVALAGGPIGPPAPLPCASLTNRTADPQGGAGRITLNTFVPDPGCWLRDIAGEVGGRGLMRFTAKVAEVMIVAGIILAIIKSVAGSSASAGLRAVMLGVLCFSAVHGYGARTGPAWLAATRAAIRAGSVSALILATMRAGLPARAAAATCSM